jgi:hypothetical protein
MATITSFDENTITTDASSTNNAVASQEIRLDLTQQSQSRLCAGADFIIIWLDANINECKADY